MQKSKRISSSNLCIKEIVALKEAGFEPVKYIFLKSFIYDFYNFSFSNLGDQVLQRHTDALAKVRTEIINELETEASKVDADGIIDVHLHVEESRQGIEVTIEGTAIRECNTAVGHFKKNPLSAFSSNLSAFDFWNLLQAGYRPISLCYGACIYHFARRSIANTFKQRNQNIELQNYTQALYNAREYAMQMMQEDAMKYNPSGILNVKISESHFCGNSHTLEFLAVGTSVLKFKDPINLTSLTNYIEI